MNKATVFGTLVREPEIRQAGDTQAVSLTLAGHRQEGGKSYPFYQAVNMIGRPAENFIQNLPAVGTAVLVEGALEENAWGEGKEKQSTLRVRGQRFTISNFPADTKQDAGGHAVLLNGINEVEVMGNVARSRFMAAEGDKRAVLFVTVAVNESYKKGDEWEERTHWTEVRVYGEQAQALKDLPDGARVLVRGHLDKYTKPAAEGEKARTNHYLVAERLTVIRLKKEKDAAPAKSSGAQQAAASLDEHADAPF